MILNLGKTMFKNIFLSLIMSLLVQNIYSMQGANEGLNANPELNFDKIELGLDISDYLGESLKIATMGSASERGLKAVFAFNLLNKFLITIKEISKLSGLDILRKNTNTLYQSREDVIIRFIGISTVLIISLLRSAWKGEIDNLGIFKLITGFGYIIANIIPLSEIAKIVKHNQTTVLQKLNQEKMMQFGWLSFNKFMPIIAYTFIQLRNSDVGFSKHLFLTLGDAESKKVSAIYKYCSLAAGISEILRVHRQAKFTKIYDVNFATNLKTS